MVVVGADGTELARAVNAREAGDPTAHAESLAMRLAAGVLRRRVAAEEFHLGGHCRTAHYVPVLLVLARVAAGLRCLEPKTGAVGSLWDRGP